MILRVYISAATNKMINDDIEKQIQKYCDTYKLKPALIKAIIKKESSFKINAIRFEKHLKNAAWYNKHLTATEKTNNFCYCSAGLMQVLFGIAKSYGYTGTPTGMIEPQYSIKYGIIHLKHLIDRYWYLEKVISAYNQGSDRTVGDIIKNLRERLEKTTNEAERKNIYNRVRYLKTKNPSHFANQSYVDKVMQYYREYGGED